MPLANDPIMSVTLIRSFRHLKHQIMSKIDYFTYSSGMIFSSCFWPLGGSGPTCPASSGGPAIEARAYRG